MVSSETPRSILWYKRFREEFSKATQYIYTIDHINHATIKRETLSNFDKETLALFIFESNNLEREGLPIGETSELVIHGLEEYPELIEENGEEHDEEQQSIRKLDNLFQKIKTRAPINFELFKSNILNKDKLKHNEIQSSESNYVLIAKHGDKKKEGKKVIQYVHATLLAELYAWEYMYSRLKYRSFLYFQHELKVGSSASRENAEKVLKENFSDGVSALFTGVFITEERIKSLHEIMANNFVDEKNAKAGQYRTKPIMTDIDSHYPAPEDIPAAMANFVTKYQEHETKNLNPIALAAWASTQFVLIHPFPDFNGRLSRLIMNMIFRAHGVPFWVSLGSSGKERTRYLRALKKCRERNYLPIATLISMQINQNFEALNDILELSGYPKITIDLWKDFLRGVSDDEVYWHGWKDNFQA